MFTSNLALGWLGCRQLDELNEIAMGKWGEGHKEMLVRKNSNKDGKKLHVTISLPIH